MKISTCTNKHVLRKIEVFIRFNSFLMYIDFHTKSHNFLKISMFSNKIFTLTSRAQLFEKVKISHKISIFFPKNWQFCTNIDVEKNTRYFTPKFQFFSPKIDSFAQILMLRKTLVTLPQSFARLDFITVLKNSLL